MTDTKHELKVIGCGFGRTGTTTLKRTLEELGFGPCYHGVEIFTHRFQADIWINIGETKHKSNINWNEMIFANPKTDKIYNCCVDWPSAHYYKELHEYYPNAKFILTIRDAHKWYNSMVNTFVPPKFGWGHELRILYWLYLKIDPFLWKFTKMEDKTFAADFGGMHSFHDNKERIIKLFMNHIENVKQYIDGDRLFILDWRRKDQDIMYEELCDFLCVEYKGQTFPRLNTTGSMRELMRQKYWESLFKNQYLCTIMLFLLCAVCSWIFVK